MGVLGRLGQRGAVLQLVVATLEAEGLADGRAPEPRDDGELLLEALETLSERRERHAVGGVLGVEPPGAQAELDPSPAHGVDLRHLHRQQTRQPERGGRDERAEPDAPVSRGRWRRA